MSTGAEIAALEQMVAAEAAMTACAQMMFEQNRMFHQFIYRAARNRYLTRNLQSLYDTLTAHRIISTMRIAARRDAVLVEHRTLYSAIARRDEEAARRAAVDHVRNALRARMQVQAPNTASKSAARRPRHPEKPKAPSRR